MEDVSRRMFLQVTGLSASGVLLGDSSRRFARATESAAVTSPELSTAMEIAGVPGMARATFRRGTAPIVVNAGTTEAKGNRKVDSDTVFEAASLSKPAVAYVTLMLADRGFLDIDKSFRYYLGASPVPDDPRGDRITLRHALSHSSGLQNWRFRADDKLAIAFEPGSGFQYSGEGFVLVSRVLEKVTEKAFATLMREQLFVPLGMMRSAFLWNESFAGNTARPHTGRGVPLDSFAVRGAKALAAYAESLETRRTAESLAYAELETAAATVAPGTPAFPNFMLPNAAASLVTTASDYARFLSALVDPLPLPESVRLRDTTRQLMFTPQSRVAPRLSWGLGVGLEDVSGGTRIWHWGDNGGTKNFFVADVASGDGQLVLTNGAGGLKLAGMLLRARYGEMASLLWV